MTEKHRTFPLPLSSVVDQGARKAAVFKPVATPQTATQNAARYAPPPYPAAKPVAAPSKSHSSALERAQAAQPAPRQSALVSDGVRRAMVQRIARQGVKDPVVLAAMESVPRHLFMDEGLAPQAYVDASLPIGHQQTISQPYIVARMIEVMRNGGPLARVLEIGTGCGYQAAVLSCVAQQVYSIERIKPLHELAKANLRPLRVPNLRLHYGDGMLGLPQAAPFDGIILAAAGMAVPQALLDQLAIGGRLVAPVGAQTQHLELITRIGKQEWTSQTLEDCHFVPLRPGVV
ncbi:protein-L-isoaspartate(D-aspartate) O-methyltransferase [Duganella sp. P38]|jgi:protein-L-isoaspartate(D-aspartate) O-methyltransferase|uniref:protein-L-isoaspartate(D-aspartate) O-methyltransferase n=1 Tax=Duganella sp. P38 TaxID=3423949 RepID=UPI003D7A390D